MREKEIMRCFSKLTSNLQLSLFYCAVSKSYNRVLTIQFYICAFYSAELRRGGLSCQPFSPRLYYPESKFVDLQNLLIYFTQLRGQRLFFFTRASTRNRAGPGLNFSDKKSLPFVTTTSGGWEKSTCQLVGQWAKQQQPDIRVTGRKHRNSSRICFN